MNSPTSAAELRCRRCRRPISSDPEIALDIFEGMHWLCFHLEFEHGDDPDRACSDATCPWRRIEFLENALRGLGKDPKTVMEQAVANYYRGLVSRNRNGP